MEATDAEIVREDTRAEKRSSSSLLKGIGKLVAICGWMMMGMFVGPLLLVIVFFVVLFSQSGGKMEEGSLAGLSSDSKKKVAVVELTGEILSSADFGKLMKKAVSRNDFSAIVVRVDTPGGAVGASEEIQRIIKAADKVKPVVCSLGNMAASGGLYAAVGCRKIIANKGTLSGSIGVIMMMPNFEQVMDKLGFKMTVVKSGQFKDAGSPFRSMTKADGELLQSLVNKAFEQFVETIASSRGLEPEKVKAFADGRVILGEEALSLGLVDELGGLEEAAKLAFVMSGNQGDPEIVPIKKVDGLRDFFENLEFSSLSLLPKVVTEPQLLYRVYY